MAPNNIPEPGDDAFTQGALNKKWIRSLWKRVVRKLRVSLPPGIGQGSFLETEEDITLDLTRCKFAASSASTHPLYTFAANDAGTPRVGIYSGYIGGIIADSSMQPDDDPFFYVTLASSAGLKYIYAEVTVAYSTSLGTWSATACEITSGTSLPSATSTKAYVQLARATVSATTAGYAASGVIRDVSGSQWFSRYGNGTTYGDYNGLI